MNDNKGIKLLLFSLTFSGLLSTTSGVILNSMDIKPTKNKITVKVEEKQVSRIKTNIPVLKEIEVEVNEPISVDVKDYITNLDDIDNSVLRDFKLDTSLVNLTQAGKYTYTISYDNKKYNGNVTVKDKAIQVVNLQIKNLKFKLNEEIPTDPSNYVTTELTPEMKEKIVLDISKVNNKVVGDYQYTITYENQLYTGVVNIYEEQPSPVINTINYTIKYVCGNNSEIVKKSVKVKEKLVVLNKTDLIFPQKFTNCSTEIDENRTNYTFPININEDVDLTIYYKEKPKEVETSEKNERTN